MPKIRVDRVGEQIKKELGQLFQTVLHDPRIGFITVTGVRMTTDLSQAKVYISILGNDEQKAQSLLSIERAKGFIRTEIGRRIRFRHVPELLFSLDTSIDYGSRIEAVLKDLNKKNEIPEGTTAQNAFPTD